MTKSTHQILYIILFVLLAVLYFIQFSSSSNIENIPTVEKQLTIQPLNEGSLNIAFVNSDTVSKYYEFAKKIQKTLTTKRSEAEGQIKSKYFAYESLVQEFEKASPIMGDREKMEKAQKIRLLEQEIMQVEQVCFGQEKSKKYISTNKTLYIGNSFRDVYRCFRQLSRRGF